MVTWIQRIKISSYIQAPIAFIIGDTPGHDKLCGRIAGIKAKTEKHKATVHPCRYCTVDFDNLDNPNPPKKHCKPMLRQQIMNKFAIGASGTKKDIATATKELKAISYNYVDNVFDKLCFGGDPAGINGATPFEILHSLLKGLMEYAHQSFFELFTESPKDQMNRVIVMLGKICSHQSYRNIPRVSFPHGIDKLAKIEGEEMPGIFLLLVIFLVSKEGERIFRSLFDQPKENDKQLGNYLCFFTHLLLLDRFYKAESHSFEDLKKAQNIFPTIMYNIKMLWNRTEGHGMKLIKFHQLRHAVADILKFGSHLNFNGGRGEATHKSLKKETKQTQRRANSTFITQSAQRESDSYIICRGINEINAFDKCNCVSADHSDKGEGDDGEDLTLLGSQYIITRNDNNSTMKMEWKKKTNTEKYQPSIHPLVLKYIHNLFPSASSNEIHGYTEVKYHKTMLRAHPCYRGKHAWYDWVSSRWEGEKGEYLAQILCWFVIKSKNNSSTVSATDVYGEVNHYITDKPYAVVTYCNTQVKDMERDEACPFLQHGTIVRHNNLPWLNHIEIDAINYSQMVIPNKENMLSGNNNAAENNPYLCDEDFIYMKPREQWPKLLLTIGKLKPF